MSHGIPSPKNTLTELDPVTFPTAASALSDSLAACMEAKVSGREVPSATKVMAVMLYFMPRAHPNIVAASPTTAVTMPMNDRAIPKAIQPPP